jgi:hypothetical protein
VPKLFQSVVFVVLLLMWWLAINWVYQVARKPAELFFPVSGRFAKNPRQTWRAYQSSFHDHSTAIMTPAFLAALSQVEAAGDPVASSYWRWRLSWNPLDVYAPASSAVGMYQTTNGAFAGMKRYCIHRHVVVEDGAWYDPRSCWFNGLYTRVYPSHAIEMTSAYLDRAVTGVLARSARSAGPKQQRDLAGLIHLCGIATGGDYAARGFSLRADQRCGTHPVSAYLARLNAMNDRFAQIEREQANSR